MWNSLYYWCVVNVLRFTSRNFCSSTKNFACFTPSAVSIPKFSNSPRAVSHDPLMTARRNSTTFGSSCAIPDTYKHTTLPQLVQHHRNKLPFPFHSSFPLPPNHHYTNRNQYTKKKPNPTSPLQSTSTPIPILLPLHKHFLQWHPIPQPTKRFKSHHNSPNHTPTAFPPPLSPSNNPTKQTIPP